MTYNIHIGVGTDNKWDLDRTAQVISDSGADIVAMQEVDNHFREQSMFSNEPKILSEKLGLFYAYGPAPIKGDPNNPSQYGNAILSRFPIIHHKNHPLTRYQQNETRTCVEAQINIDGKTYTVLATHLDNLSLDGRIQQTRDILNLIPKNPKRLILLGDFNNEPPVPGKDESDPIAIIRQRLEDCFELAGSGQPATFKDGQRLDYIFVSPDLAKKVQNCHVIRTDLTSVTSDHFPLVMIISK